MPDKTWDVLGDLPSDASATSSDEDDDGDRGDGSRGGPRGGDLAAPEPRQADREITSRRPVHLRRSYSIVVAAMDEDARRRRGSSTSSTSAAAKDDEGDRVQREEARRARGRRLEDSDSDAKRPQLVQKRLDHWRCADV